ncbi:MAG: hypothetical protein ACFFD4_33710 [Candidatus Odinarchaeota archaeon]
MAEQQEIRDLKDLLNIFSGYIELEDIPQDFDLLREINDREIPIKAEFIQKYEQLKLEKKDAINKNLWTLAHPEKQSPKDRQNLYMQWSKGYENFFGWEEVSEPGGWCQTG